jgi:predicted GNAT family acetyltransferase
MQVTTYESASDFLKHAQKWLEAEEVTNSLMLGIALRLQSEPTMVKERPCLKLVEAERGPVLALVMTPPYNAVLSGKLQEAREAIPLLVDNLQQEAWPVPGVKGPKALADVISRYWVDRVGGSFRIKRNQRLHALRNVLIPRNERGALRMAEERDLETVVLWNKAFLKEALDIKKSDRNREFIGPLIDNGSVYLWGDGRPLSMAMKTRPIRNGISIGFVYTPPALRRQGYATACVAELSRELLASGWEFCALFTDLANPTSNHIYHEIGYRPVADFDEYEFLPEV